MTDIRARGRRSGTLLRPRLGPLNVGPEERFGLSTWEVHLATVGTEKVGGEATDQGVGDLSSLVAVEVPSQLGALRSDLEKAIAEVRERTPEDRAAIVVFSGDLDRVLAAFVIATGAAAAGLETSMFFTFWGLSAVKKKGAMA